MPQNRPYFPLSPRMSWRARDVVMLNATATELPAMTYEKIFTLALLCGVDASPVIRWRGNNFTVYRSFYGHAHRGKNRSWAHITVDPPCLTSIAKAPREWRSLILTTTLRRLFAIRHALLISDFVAVILLFSKTLGLASLGSGRYHG